MFSKEYDGTPVRLSSVSLKFAVPVMVLAAALGAFAMIGVGPDWEMIGKDSNDNRNQPFEFKIGVETARHLGVKWRAKTTGDVSATPAVVDRAVYFGDFGGTEWKLDAATGDVIWSHQVSDYTGIPGDISRTSPSLAGNTLVIGDLSAPNIMGINATTGELRWITPLDPDSHAIITGSPVLAGDTIYVGSSQSGTLII